MKTDPAPTLIPDPITIARRITTLQAQGRMSAAKAVLALKLLWQ